MKTFGKQLSGWYQQNRRPLPWRETSDPYAIWLSEIILQQTRVNQGLPYYQQFIQTYPTVNLLAAASPTKVFKLWQGLGYYRRAENMIKTAHKITTEYNGLFPTTFSELKTLPGIGDYTAAAIASIAFNEKVAVVDGNVYRVLSRLFGIKTEIQSTQAKKEFSKLMLSLMNNTHPGTFNESVMEFGALQCVPGQPNCRECIFKNRCYAYRHHKVEDFPVVKAKIKRKKRFIYYLVVEWNHHLVMNHRNKNDIWKGLFDFPSLEFNSNQTDEALLHKINNLDWIAPETLKIVSPFSAVYKQQLTHIDISARFIHLQSGKKPSLSGKTSHQLIPQSTLRELAVPKLIERFLEDVFYRKE